ncbi:hypothetical protein EYF80_022456 [Liparis tanakae]|uniref:Uncharacterized protein n=1 Tax=Liparis tanakae TaxID=230148 RepID=A0A4Z2HNE5_9TELE|nr:hypothetical protein EYF80_022456 [Liparis tanakae]
MPSPSSSLRMAHTGTLGSAIMRKLSSRPEARTMGVSLKRMKATMQPPVARQPRMARNTGMMAQGELHSSLMMGVVRQPVRFFRGLMSKGHMSQENSSSSSQCQQQGTPFTIFFLSPDSQGKLHTDSGTLRSPPDHCISSGWENTTHISCEALSALYWRLSSIGFSPSLHSAPVRLTGMERSSRVPVGAPSERLPHKPRSSGERRAVNRMLS